LKFDQLIIEQAKWSWSRPDEVEGRDMRSGQNVTLRHTVLLEVSLEQGTSRRELIATAQRAIQIGIPGARVRSVRRQRSKSCTVLVVERCSNWTPKAANDTPPNIERHTEPSAAEAVAFQEGFNAAEMRDPKGYWAVV
jgi:hypothetical protein